MDLSLSISRTPAALVITNAPGGSMWLESVSRPSFDWRRSYASSPFTRPVQTSAVKDGGVLEVVMYASAATSAALDALRDEVTDAAEQFYFTATVTEDGVTSTYECDCAAVAWNSHDAGMARGYLARVALSIPCYPSGA